MFVGLEVDKAFQNKNTCGNGVKHVRRRTCHVKWKDLLYTQRPQLPVIGAEDRAIYLP